MDKPPSFQKFPQNFFSVLGGLPILPKFFPENFSRGIVPPFDISEKCLYKGGYPEGGGGVGGACQRTSPWWQRVARYENKVCVYANLLYLCDHKQTTNTNDNNT